MYKTERKIISHRIIDKFRSRLCLLVIFSSFTFRTYEQSFARYTRKISIPSAQGKLDSLESEKKIFANRIPLKNESSILSQTKLKTKNPILYTNYYSSRHLTFYKSNCNPTIVNYIVQFPSH